MPRPQVLRVFFIFLLSVALLALTGCAGVGGATPAPTPTATPTPTPGPATITISAQPAIIAQGQTTAISWSSTNATSVAITPSLLSEDQTALALSGSVTIVPTATITYTAVATGADGKTATATANVSMLSVTLTATPAKIAAGQSAILSWTSTNATSLSIDQGIGSVTGAAGTVSVTPATPTTYTITATNGTATATSSVTVSTALGVTLKAAPANITSGAQSTLSWTSSNAATLSIDNGIGAVTAPAGTKAVSPTANTTYTITATDAAGNVTTAAVTVSVSNPGGNLQTLKHIIVMVQENRSFDNYFSKLGEYAAGRLGPNIPYQINAGYNPNILLPLFGGGTGHPFHQVTERTENLSPSWDESHFDIDQQADGTFKMDRFAITTHSVAENFDNSGLRALGYYDQTDLPYYYELGTQFAVSDSFHSSLLANTVPNRQYLFCATSQGRIFPSDAGHAPWTCPTIFSSLQNAGVNWKYYYSSGIFLFQFADWSNPAIRSRTEPIKNLFALLASPTADQDLPQFIFIENGNDPNPPPGTQPETFDEHPDGNVQLGAAYVKSIIDALMASPAWNDSVFILAYDEGGGLYDHVPPFTVVPPDADPPQLGPNNLPGDFTLSGFRVPLIVVSPWVKPHFVSHVNRETTSLLKLIETRFGLPPLTARDAAADDMTEFFDFINPPTWLTPPPLPAQPTNGVDDQSKEAPPQ